MGPGRELRRRGVLTLSNVQVLYDKAIEAVRDVSLERPAGRIVALLGSNGAGKSTLLKAISSVLSQEDGEIVGGAIHLDGDAADGPIAARDRREEAACRFPRAARCSRR